MQNVVVAVPVRGAPVPIGDCLRAIALQQTSVRPEILLLVIDPSDGSSARLRRMLPTLPCRVHLVDQPGARFPSDASQGLRQALSQAAMLAGAGSVMWSTEASCCVAPDWLEANLAALAAGADAVCGQMTLDPAENPRPLQPDLALAKAYGAQLDRIGALLDPDASDPWPRHTTDSGASLALRWEAFVAAGGVPPVGGRQASALVASLRRIDAKIRHDPEVTVTVSGCQAERVLASVTVETGAIPCRPWHEAP